MRLDLVRDGGGVAPHELVAQGLVVEHLAPALGRRVEDHAFAEDRRHEGVGLGLVEHLLGGPEEQLVGLGPGEQHHVAVGQPELPDVAALVADPAHEPDGVDAAAPRDARARRLPPIPGAVRAVRRRRSWCASCAVLVAPVPSGTTGASGWTSIKGRWVPGGVDTAAITAAATAGGRRKWLWRAAPNRIHSPRTSVVVSGPQSVPISVRVWPGWTMVARTPVPSSSSCSARTRPSSPHFDAM